MRAHRYGTTAGSARNRLLPTVEPCEGRSLLSAIAPAPAAHTAAASLSMVDRLAPYTSFVGQIQRGPHAGQIVAGQIVLGITDGRGQVIGLLFQSDGTRATVVGGIFGSRVSLLIYLPRGGQVQISGVGGLVRVRGGLPDGLALVGSGILRGPGKADVGMWQTLRPVANGR